MSALLVKRVRWWPSFSARLLTAAPTAFISSGGGAWRELLRDPALASQARWGALLDGVPLGEAVLAGRPEYVAPVPREGRASAQARVEDVGPRSIDHRAVASPALRRWAETRTVSELLATEPSERVAIDPLPANRARQGRGRPERRFATVAMAQPAETPVDEPSHASPAASSRVVAARPGLLESLAASDLPPSTPTHLHHSLAPATTIRLVQDVAGLGRLLSRLPRDAAAVTSAPLGQEASAITAEPVGAMRDLTAAPIHPASRSERSPNAMPSSAPLAQRADDPASIDVDAVVDALVERLRIEYLRNYGSAG